MLAPLIFRQVGENFKCWHFVEWSYGYNLSFGDNVVVHRYVLLDDRGGIEIGNNVSISDYANIYSHTHDVEDIHNVYNLTTRIGDGARITYHATVLAGTQVGEHAMVGTSAVVYPAAQLQVLAKQGGAFVIEVNPEPTNLSSRVNVTILGKAVEVLPSVEEN